jgi:hypothetical protein
MQTYYIINPCRGAEIPVTKRSVGAKQCPVEPKVFNKFASDDASLHGTWS